jgi:hypothetical protein
MVGAREVCRRAFLVNASAFTSAPQILDSHSAFATEGRFRWVANERLNQPFLNCRPRLDPISSRHATLPPPVAAVIDEELFVYHFSSNSR